MFESSTRARAAGLVVMLVALTASNAPGQSAASATPRVLTPEEARVLQALAADARTAPFMYATSVRDGRVVLSGRVGSTGHHAAAMDVALATGIPITDRLVIDTAEMTRVPRPVPVVQQTVILSYPPPVFAGSFDPVFGFEPPLISYPPWWPAMSARRLAEAEPAGAAVPPNSAPAPNPSPAATAPPARNPAPVPPPPVPGNIDADAPPPPPRPQAGTVTLTSKVLAALHARPGLADGGIKVTNHGGRITLSGDVASLQDAFAAFQVARRTPGVEAVLDQLRYPVPAPDRPNPLVTADRAEDVAAFLRGHVTRHLGEGTTLRHLGVEDDHLRIAVDLAPSRDPEQVAAVLRSMPLLRGFALDLDLPGGAVGAK